MLRLTSAVAAFFALTFLAGCGGKSSSSNPPPTSPQLTISSTSLTFPSTTVGQTSAAQVLTLTNSGTATLTLSSAAVSGSSADFALTSASTCGASTNSLAPSASCTFSITFSPQTTGTLTATVTLTDNASNSPQTVTLTGVGATAPPQVTLSPSSFSFPSTIVGQTSQVLALTVTNSGSSTLTLTGAAITGAAADFALTSASTCTSSSSLAPGTNCTFAIAFTPQTAGTLTATLTLTDNASNSPQTVTLTGNGTAVLIAKITLSPIGLNFSSTPIDTTSAIQTVTLTNTGNAPLAVPGIALGGANATNFAENNNCTTALAPSSSCSISVTFSPTVVTNYIATLTIKGNASNSPLTVTLTGIGAAVPAPVATLTPATGLFFPLTTVGQTSAAMVLKLTNSGNAALTLSSAITGASAADFAITSATTCGGSLAAGATCTFALTFAPQATGTLKAAFTLTDNTGNVANSTQTVTLTGPATATPKPQTTLTPATALIFPSTVAGQTSAAQALTLTNTGNATLSITGITLGGTNPTDFSETNTCPATLTAGSSCPITVTFSPAAAAAYTASLTVTDNSGNTAGSTQSVALKGVGSSGPVTVTRTLHVFPESDNSVTPLYTLLNQAQSSIDMTMYKVDDTTFLGDLVAACTRGVTVRAVLDASVDTMANNTPAFNQLNTSGANCSAVFSNTAFTATHQRTITVDGATTAIMTLNLQSQYYATARDFALVENDPADVTAIETAFNTDYAAGTTYAGTQGASDLANQGGAGDDLIWSPTTATSRTTRGDMLGIINSATKTLLIENEEMSDSDVVNALVAACSRKTNPVAVQIVMSEDSTTAPLSPYAMNWIDLEAAGCGVHVYADTTTGLYIHANAVVADYGLSTQNAYVGSINYSTDSMTENRELGLYLTDPTAVTLLNTTMSADYTGGVVFPHGIVD